MTCRECKGLVCDFHAASPCQIGEAAETSCGLAANILETNSCQESRPWRQRDIEDRQAHPRLLAQ